MKTLYHFATALFLTMTAALAAAADLPLGRGDVLKISVFGNPDLSLEAKVGESGAITFPLIGEVSVEGLVPAEAERTIARRLESGGFVRRPQVNIQVSSFQSQQVSVLGLVNRPGRYPMDGKRTLVDMLALAGGISPEGGDTAVLVRNRAGQPYKEVIDLPDMMHSGDLRVNAELQGGDIIYVERAPKFYIYGEVQRPGAYRLEKNMTVIQALSAGGGLNPRGTERGVRIKRLNGHGGLDIIDAGHGDVLRPDDVVFVRESLF
ncbi:polysaccharide export protein EpsE [Massilia haematophila]|uniref:Polysaccharide export protein EpsE n=1 Tax=Massilia haematophila TaxID=457923 RepID=A0ABV7PKN6_9BURK|nr:polysaccharide export protein EpsE [Massilia sp.]